jgi:Raf kinase inhibitor-like YbhB/YbcL family protein
MKSGNLLLLTATLVGAIFCAKSMNTQETRARQPFQLSSPAFQPGAAIPQQYSCQGADISPALHWGDAPLGTASFAIVVDDPDAPVGNWLHWTIWNIRAGAHDLAENVPKQEQLTDGSRQGRNDFRKIGYNGPCPPAGKTHRYFFRLYALDKTLDLAPGAARADLDAAMQGHVLGKSEYMGTFKR